MQCAALWIGSSLGPVERACLRSVLRQGHKLDLYCYSKPDGVPAGVALRDAAGILPRSSIVRHHSVSVSMFSNRFRYELQRRSLGTWLPVRWQEADWILDPGRTLEDVVTPQTVSVHFWNERIKEFKHRSAPPGSVLARLHAEGRA